jgi:hypothetical protein
MRTVEEVPRVLVWNIRKDVSMDVIADHLRDAKTLVIVGFIVGKFYLFKQYSCGSN